MIAGIICIIAVYYNLGVWALVIKSLSFSITTTLLFWLIGRWYPRHGFSFQSFKALFNFGSKLLACGIIHIFFENIYNVFIGRFYKTEQLGYYAKANQLATLTSISIISVIQTVSYPLLTSLQSDTAQMKKAFRKLLKVAALVTFPIMIGFALLSEQTITILLTEKWAFAADLLFWLALSSVFTPIGSLNLNMLNAIGRSDLFLKLEVLKIQKGILTMIIPLQISEKAMLIVKLILISCSFL